MEWVLAALAVVVIGLAALAAAGQLGALPAPDDDTYHPNLPAGAITSSQLRSHRFAVAIRGYDMKQVDALLDRLADQLDAAQPAATRREPTDSELGLAGRPDDIVDPVAVPGAPGVVGAHEAPPAADDLVDVAPARAARAIDQAEPSRWAVDHSAPAAGRDTE